VTSFIGTRPLLKVTARQDARNIAPWIAVITMLSASSVLAYAWVFPDQKDRQELASAIGGNPALSLIFGPARDLTTADGFNAWRAGLLGAFFSGLMAILIVVRNSRADEDSGRAELLASGVLARPSRLMTAVALASMASVALGVICFLATIACGGGVISSAVLSATFAASGLMFAGVAAVTAQLGSEARTASSLAMATLGILYVVRGYIDSSGTAEWAIWVTPFGWLEETRPATGNNPWPLLLALVFSIAMVAIAFELQSRRDFGGGIIASRPGAAHAGIVGNVWGLALRLHRGALISWLIALAILGLIFGRLSTSIDDIAANNPAMADFVSSGGTDEAGLTLAFLTTILQMIGILAAVLGVQVTLRIRTEEFEYRVEPLLAGSLRRPVYFATNAAVALFGSALALVVSGTCLGLVAARLDDTVSVGDVFRQAIATIPAAWTLVALALAAVGAVPKLRLVSWAGIVATFGITILGPTFKFPGWALGISPLYHVPSVAASDPNWTGLCVVASIGVVLVVIGFVGFSRRDIHRI